MSARLIAIGDVHGCHLALKALLEAIAPTPKDRLVTLGDYIDRGPDSRSVIDQLLAAQSRCELISLLGNHEVMMLAARDFPGETNLWMRCGGKETLASYGDSLADVPEEHWRFIDNLLPCYETAEFFFIHANYLADYPISEQPDWVAYWEHLDNLPPAPHESGKTAIVGHTPQISGQILDRDFVKCIDTCCFGGGYLTAYDVETGDTWQADANGDLRES